MNDKQIKNLENREWVKKQILESLIKQEYCTESLVWPKVCKDMMCNQCRYSKGLFLFSFPSSKNKRVLPFTPLKHILFQQAMPGYLKEIIKSVKSTAETVTENIKLPNFNQLGQIRPINMSMNLTVIPKMHSTFVSIHNNDELKMVFKTEVMNVPRLRTINKSYTSIQQLQSSNKHTSQPPHSVSNIPSEICKNNIELLANGMNLMGHSKTTAKNNIYTFYGKHRHVYRHVLKSLLKNTAEFIPKLRGSVKDEYFEKFGDFIYNKYVVLCCYLQNYASFYNDYWYCTPGCYKSSTVDSYTSLVEDYGSINGLRLYNLKIQASNEISKLPVYKLVVLFIYFVTEYLANNKNDLNSTDEVGTQLIKSLNLHVKKMLEMNSLEKIAVVLGEV